jgi:Protein of unknown function (DUF3313)
LLLRATDLTAADQGLATVKGSRIDHVYVRPGINLSAYDKVMLDPVEVSCAKSGKPDRSGGPISADEMQEIRSQLVKIFKEELEKELPRSHGYALVYRPEPDVPSPLAPMLPRAAVRR